MNKKIVISILLLSALVWIFFFKHVDYTKASGKLDSIILKVMLKYKIKDDNLLKEVCTKESKGKVEYLHIEREYGLTKTDFKSLKESFEKALNNTGFKIFRSNFIKEKGKEELNIEIHLKKYNILTLRFFKKSIAQAPALSMVPGPQTAERGKVAIILDDFGYSTKNLQLLSEIKYPLTLSILPNLTYSKKVALWAKGHSLDSILHLPLEPYEKNGNLEQNTILTSMNRQKVEKILKNDLDSVPGIKGISNHMGSKATEDEKLMKIIFEELKRRNLFYIDSLATNKSVCKELAKDMKLKYAQRNIFLDNENNEEYIKGQLKKLEYEAKALGFAIGIGHDRPKTIAALKEIMPEMANSGIEFIYVSEIVN